MSGRFLFGDGGHCGMTKNLPLRKMHFMAQRVRAAGQAMQRKDDCSRPLAQGLCGGIPQDVQDFLRPLAQPAVLSAAGFYDLCAESSCGSGYRPEKRPERGQPIYDRPAWGGMIVSIPAGRHRRLYVAKKRDRRPLSGTPISFWGCLQQPFFDEVKEFLGKTRGRISP